MYESFSNVQDLNVLRGAVLETKFNVNTSNI